MAFERNIWLNNGQLTFHCIIRASLNAVLMFLSYTFIKPKLVLDALAFLIWLPSLIQSF